MDLHGSVAENLQSAIASAIRLREHPVYAETLVFWRQLLNEARRSRKELAGAELAALEALTEKLEHEIAQRP
jgi:hypothetical protein